MSERSIWAVLGLGATQDRGEIRRAYAARLKNVSPEDDPEGFKALRGAYEAAMALAARTASAFVSAEIADAPDLAESIERGPRTAAPGDEQRREPAITPGPDANARPPELATAKLDRDCARLAELIRNQPRGPDLKVALDAVLSAEGLEDVGVYLRTEIWLADLIARNSPNSDDLIEASATRFGWSQGNSDRYVHPAIGAVLRRRIHASHLGALADLERLVSGPDAPTELELDKALRAVMTRALEDDQLYLHTESELCRLILEHAPRLDEHIGTISSQFSWARKAGIPHVAQVLHRYETMLLVRKLRTRSDPRRAAFRALQKPPGRFEAIRQSISPKRYASIRSLLGLLRARHGEVFSSVPPNAVAGWDRYYRYAKLNPFIVLVTLVTGLLFAGCQYELALHRAVAVARYYPTNAYRQAVSGKVVLRCRPEDGSRLGQCVLIKEEPSGYGFGASALRLAADGRLGYEYSSGLAAVYDATVEFVAARDGGSRSIRLEPPTPYGGDQPAIDASNSASEVQASNDGRYREIRGVVRLRCLQSPGGRLSQCAVVSESPPGHDLGHNAAAMAMDGVLKPPDGIAAKGGWIEFRRPGRCRRIHRAPSPATSVGSTADLSAPRGTRRLKLLPVVRRRIYGLFGRFREASTQWIGRSRDQKAA